MKFSRIIGKIDPKLVFQAEEKLSQVFLELGTRYNNEHVGVNNDSNIMLQEYLI